MSSTHTNHQCPQNQIVLNNHESFSPDSSTIKFMDHKSSQDPLKCPRCSSSNTKFCYYNNYSLTQPRHFCKACKRYWTRGGTLRNVPVGGGCRKNKRVKRSVPPSTTGGDGISTAAVKQPETDLADNNPLFYGMPTNNSLELNFPFSRFGSTRVFSQSSGMFDHQGRGGLGFSIQNNGYENGFKEISTSSSSILFGSSSSFGPNSTMADLFVHDELRNNQESNNFQGLMPYEDVLMGKEMKVEGDQNRSGWNPDPNPNRVQEVNQADPSSSLLWNTNWFDPSNMGSSVPSLI